MAGAHADPEGREGDFGKSVKLLYVWFSNAAGFDEPPRIAYVSGGYVQHPALYDMAL